MRRDRDIRHRRERALEHKENSAVVNSDKGWPEWMKDPKLLPKKPPRPRDDDGTLSVVYVTIKSKLPESGNG